jgi:hypothetical protein
LSRVEAGIVMPLPLVEFLTTSLPVMTASVLADVS